ncbi:MAG: Helix-turn-helix domain [Thermoleophilaceae bacterium]|nr:Helix-turn-helix domain [Thermoleophilaceae bacterium]
MTDFDSRYLTPDQVAQDLQMDISTIYKQCKAKVIPAVRIGGSVRIPRIAYERMLAEQVAQAAGTTTIPELPAETVTTFDPDQTVAGFCQRFGRTPSEWVEAWRAGEIEDTPDHTRATIWALALRDAQRAERVSVGVHDAARV